MSLEPGGRADKYGNRYENRYLAKLLLRLVQEELTSVTVEPLGEGSDYVEFIAEQKNGPILYYQCKASNTTHTSWSISDLRKYNVFIRAKKIIETDTRNLYYFISPLQYGELSELCNRARTNFAADDFVKYQLNNKKLKDWFSDCVAELKLSKDDPTDITKAVSILSHCYFEQYAAGQEAERDLESFIGLLFSGKASTVRVLLEQFANDTSSYGVKITSNDIINYLAERGIHKRNYNGMSTVLDRINIINATYWGTFNAINDTLIHRDATDDIIENIRCGCSVVLHGKAGTGKSGCLEEIINYLRQNNILFLTVKLDKHVPSVSADEFGRKLGLPESPVYCLSTLAAGKLCVLILDQLDALRWTCSHSSDALDVCKELIKQAETLNEYCDGKISIVFASRTFDLENDNGLKGLFEDTDASHALIWKKVRIDNLSADNVIQLIGQKYNDFSSRLKKLLLVPSSLYVWSKLEENSKKNSISSVFELMNTWWRQIQQNCSAVNIQTQSIIDCKSKIVNTMESRDTFSVPKVIFFDQTNEIDFLVSMGLLTCNAQTKSISFSHQSFLDYFITSDLVAKIFNGHELEDLLGSFDEQTPLNRYRLISVLQNLLESDPTLFAKQSVSLLQASSVRFYFKCAVFEVISQCDSPTAVIYKIIDEYYQKPEWSDYITQVVFYSHPQFVTRLHTASDCVFPSDLSLSLLKSISDIQPDFVVKVLEPFAFQNSEHDTKIFFSLCHDANYDSYKMFSLRKELLQNNPNLFSSFWGFPGLIKHKSLRAIELFEIIVESWPNETISHVYFGDAKHMGHYIKQNASVIVTKLFPVICRVTAEYLPQWPNDRWNREFEDWISYNYQESAVRSITEIVKDSFAEWAQSTPDELFSYIKDIVYPISAIGHECIMHGLLHLPPSFADKVLSWLLENSNQKIFVYSSNEKDFVAYSAKIIKKFSPQCADIIFQRLERYICNWKEPVDQMVFAFNSRLEVRKERHTSVYYAYWGHFQKALLPSLDNSRLSKYAKQLLGVVNRNPWIHLPYFYCGFSMGEAKTVVSPVENKAERLSNKTWLQIISTPAEKMNDRWGGRETENFYVEASHEAFASALGNQAKSEPMRFANLALSFPDGCYAGYISHILYALDDNTSGSDFDIDLVSKVIRRFGKSNNSNIAIATSRVIEAHANEIWPDDILRVVEWIALFHPNPAKDEYCISSNSDPEHQSFHSLLDNSINCARGCAFRAIGALLWTCRELGDCFKSAISSGLNDPNPAVKFAVMHCVVPYYNIDRAYAAESFSSLLESDIRVLCAPGSWEIMSREYEKNCSYYRKAMIKACTSGIDDLAEHAARLMCAAAVYFNDQEALNFIFANQMSDKQQAKICIQAITAFNQEEYHERSEKILIYLIDHSQNELHGFSRLFFDRCIDIQRDENFLIHLMESAQGVHLLHSFMGYLCESDENICSYACVLEAISNRLPHMSPDVGIQIVIKDLVKCIIRLFDSGKDDLHIRRICLNAWDKLFMSNLQDIKPLADMIDDFE